MRIETKLIHAGARRPRPDGAVSTPIYQSSTFEQGGESDYHDVRYIRLNNTPNHEVLSARLSALEQAEAGLVTASGMAAISSIFLSVLSSGDHLLAHDCLYGGTHDLITKDLLRLGISCSFVDASRPETWALEVNPRTRAFYVETLTNPLLEVTALDDVARFARERGIVSIIDNTFATPINFRPVEHGFDLVAHSASKYLNGHSDLVAGAVLGRAPLVKKVKQKVDHLGGTLDPHACYLLERGLKTLALRVRHQNESALALARFLDEQPAVKVVHHPGLSRHPHHERAKRLLGGGGGTFSFELEGGKAAAERFIAATEIPVYAPSLGGPETLITRPAASSHAGLDPADRERLGITEGLIRISIGLETTEDLQEDFAAALRSTH